MSRPKLPLYRVVTHNGAGVHSGYYRSLPKAREACRRIAEREREVLERIGYVNEFEIERVQEIGTAHRYWMRRRKRWILWDPHQDVDDREPDFMIRVGRSPDA